MVIMSGSLMLGVAGATPNEGVCRDTLCCTLCIHCSVRFVLVVLTYPHSCRSRDHASRLLDLSRLLLAVDVNRNAFHSDCSSIQINRAYAYIYRRSYVLPFLQSNLL